jgi:transposase-like protein
MAARIADCGMRIAEIAEIAEIADWNANQPRRSIQSAIESAIPNPQSAMPRSATRSPPSAMVRSLASPVCVDLQLASDQWLRDGFHGLVGVKQRAVDPLEE